MISDRSYPAELQFKPSRIQLDEAVAKAKAALLSDIKRSAYIYRCDLGGCNGCEIEIFSTITPVFDAERFGIKNTASPRHADILVYTGAVTRAMRMPGLRAWEAAPDPKLVVAYGACGCSGGIFHDCYCTWGGTNEIVPVDVYIPGCPPSPAQTIYGFAMALGMLGQKLKRVEEEAGSELGALEGLEVPYKVRTALKREARLMSGYQLGSELADEFMRAVHGSPDGMARIRELALSQADPRRAEVFSRLSDLLAAMTVEPARDEALLAAQAKTVFQPVHSQTSLYEELAKGAATRASAEELARLAAQRDDEA